MSEDDRLLDNHSKLGDIVNQPISSSTTQNKNFTCNIGNSLITFQQEKLRKT